MSVPDFRAIADLFGFEPEVPSELIEDEVPTGLNTLEKGEVAMNSGQFERAVGIFRQAVEESKGDSLEAVFNLAASLEAVDEIPQAMEQYNRALELQPDTAEPHLGLGELYKREGRGKEALMEIERAIESDPTNAYYHFKLAELSNNLGYPRKAYELIQRSILLAPDHAFYHAWTGDLLIKLKRFPDALDALRAAIELSPGDDLLYLRAAIAFWGAQRYADSIKSSKIASELNPEKSAYLWLTEALLRLDGQKMEADELLKDLGELDRYDQQSIDQWLAEATL